MPFCTKCGAPIGDDQTLCAACSNQAPAAPAADISKAVEQAGDALENTVDNILDANQFPASFEAKDAKPSFDVNKAVNQAGDLLGNTVETILNTQDNTAAFDAQDIADNKITAALSYIFILFLLPMFTAKQSAFCQYHAKQGANLCILSTALCVVVSLLGALLGGIPFIGVLVWIVAALAYSVCLGYTVFGVAFTLMGKAKELPFINQIKIIQ